MATDFSGTFEQSSQENFEKFLECMNVPWIAQKAQAVVNVKQEIQQEGDNFKIKITAGPMSKELCFTVGQEFDHDQFQKGKAVAKWEDGKLHMTVTPVDDSKKGHTATREKIDDDTHVLTTTCGDVVAKRTFKRVK